jgi:tripartite-type tricarboxylate transporter receptor subunit TctC
MNRRSFLIISAAFASGLGASKPVFAQSSSSQPMRVILPLIPGGGADAYAHLLADHMAKTLGRIIIVEYKPGANGNLGTRFAAQAPADGELILVTTQSITEINPSAYSNPKWSLSDFMPLIRGVTAPLVLVTHPSVPARTLSELVAWIKENPGKLSYSSYTAGTPSHFLGFQLNKRFGLDLVHVPSKGSARQATDLMAGHVLFGFAQMQASRPLIQNGKLNPIAITGAVRSRFLPSVPTFAEIGHDEFTASVWFGLMVRAGTPPPVVERLLNAAKAAHTDAHVKAKLEAQGQEMSGQSGPEFEADIRTQADRWARLVQAAGFKAD